MVCFPLRAHICDRRRAVPELTFDRGGLGIPATGAFTDGRNTAAVFTGAAVFMHRPHPFRRGAGFRTTGISLRSHRCCRRQGTGAADRSSSQASVITSSSGYWITTSSNALASSLDATSVIVHPVWSAMRAIWLYSPGRIRMTGRSLEPRSIFLRLFDWITH